DRRDSLPTHFNALTVKAYSSSLPENYTIDHSILQKQQQQQYQERRRRSSATATAAGTGGRTIRPMTLSPSQQQQQQQQQQQHRRIQHHSCEACGKVYKHPSCLAKHRWEHSEQWELTSKFLLTKHQQVQMLEAAAILVSMDRESQQESQGGDVSCLHRDNEDEEAFWIDI
ncbi:hypothetical protein BX666DRAFT_1837210, partial [Dichotomocladium elegans]